MTSTHPTPAPVPPPAPAADPPRSAAVSARVLTAFADLAPLGARGEEYSVDFGPAVLAALTVAADGPRTPPAPAPRAVAAWLRQLRQGCTHPGLFGWGLGGYLLGLRTAAAAWPRLGGLADTAYRELAACSGRWRTEGLAWCDYDLVTGTAGSLLALAADPACTRRDVAHAVGHLTALCADADLRRLRVGRYKDEEMRGWNHDRVNSGAAHGAAGVATALCRAADATGLTPEIAASLEHVASWYLTRYEAGTRSVVTWPPAGGLTHLPSRPLTWCYGTPGIAWALWETGRVLDDAPLREFALHAATSFLRGYDEEADHPDLSLCHGQAGLALVCDAFHRHAGLAGAAALRDRLVARLLERLDEVTDLAARDGTLLTGATGACAALLTLESGASGDRSWLAAFGLR
ncbi:lanthionine synthetase LanC family protein [Streptomyces formicae]|uniref:Lanthionine biosynthesis cyclase LanC n=1 Tax=Streptomyces formicae TaxID=1616117 RepID=A0A291Q1B9_9ACTN|nr:lanthionine synthetase LanC family protein [Streptomyces formicae]ATL25288.1 Lanthionine biosynthesis cyclase LanC [Streptomyces formicae]